MQQSLILNRKPSGNSGRLYIDQSVAEVNEAIRDGKVPPNSKTPELIPRVTAAPHMFNHTIHRYWHWRLGNFIANCNPNDTLSKTLLPLSTTLNDKKTYYVRYGAWGTGSDVWELYERAKHLEHPRVTRVTALQDQVAVGLA